MHSRALIAIVTPYCTGQDRGISWEQVKAEYEKVTAAGGKALFCRPKLG